MTGYGWFLLVLAAFNGYVIMAAVTWRVFGERWGLNSSNPVEPIVAALWPLTWTLWLTWLFIAKPTVLMFQAIAGPQHDAEDT